MCGRYYIPGEDDAIEAMIASIDGLARIGSAQGGGSPVKTGEIFPKDTVLSLDAYGKPQAMRWGFAKYGGGLVINAKSESAESVPMFAASIRRSRCLLPASCYFEWQKPASFSGKKQKYAISPGKCSLFYMAGLYREEAESPLPTFVILTREADSGIRHIHDRMPVILPKEACSLWLSGGDAKYVFSRAESAMNAEKVGQLPLI